MVNHTALTNFIDEKFVPLKPRAKLVIKIVIVVLPILLFYFISYKPVKQKIQSLDQQRTLLKQQVQIAKEKASNFDNFNKQVEVKRNNFIAITALLPQEQEIPKLLKDISALGRAAGLDFLTFKPLADITRDFYTEIPITINVRGPYHNMGLFLDQVSKLERIVSVSNIRMSSPTMADGEMLLNSYCKLITYRFTDVELAKEPEK